MEVPAPNESDPEDVTTALETAAIFATRGDASEAARWLGRAADFANLAGNAARAETLALSARALSETRGDASDDTESEIARPLPAPPPMRVSVRPQAPSERPQDRDGGNSQPMLLVRPPSATPVAPATRSATPGPPSVRAATSPPLSVRTATSPPLSVRTATSPPLSVRGSSPSASSPTPSPRPEGATAVASSPSPTPSPSAVAPSTAAPSAAAPSAANALAAKEQHSAKEQQEISAVRESSPRASTPPKPVETHKPATKPSLHHDLHRPFRLQGARVSIAPSQGSSRYYVLKVLEDGEPIPQGEHEAFLVLTDPDAAR